MQRIMTILGVILLIGVLIYILMTGLGLTRSFKRHKNTLKTQIITDFEYPNDDLDWTTGGYVNLESSTENKTHGKYSAKATFLLANQFFATPTPSAPSQIPIPTATWQPEIALDTTSITQLKVYEWQEYADLKMDIFNAQDQPVTYHLQIADSRAFVYETSGVMTPKKVTNVSIPLDQLLSQRLHLTNIRSLRFWVDTAGFTQPVVVYLDYIRLEGDATAPKANPAPTPKR
jgi:hypothetical protein